MKIKKIIIGKNSRIVNEISSSLNDFHIISHKDVIGYDFTQYDYVYLFSWSHDCQYANRKLLSLLPLDKVVFISTTAVNSLLIRDQWASYPNNKYEAENIVLKSGGRVLRIGVFDKAAVDNYYGLVPYTPSSMLVDILNGTFESGDSVVQCFEVVEGGIVGIKRYIGRALNSISLRLPNNALFQVPLCAFIKLFRINNYSYSGDSISTFSQLIQIGYGALGGYLASLKKVISVTYLVSRCDNVYLSDRGFVGTIIGKTPYGLSSLWHGVYLDEAAQTKMIVRSLRSRLPLDSVVCEIEKIDFNNMWNLFSKSHPTIPFVSKSLILAAGPYENIRLLSTLCKFSCQMSDHELAHLGTVNIKDVREYARTYMGCFFVYSKSFVYESAGMSFLLDFRPSVKDKSIDSVSFYVDCSSNVIKKIIKSFAFDRLNEAFFNRFGISFKTNSLDVYIQIKAINCISFNDDEGFSRRRISNEEWSRVQEIVVRNFKTFKPAKRVISVDAQHTVGAPNVLKLAVISELVEKKRLLILGSPTNFVLGAAHHTVRLRNMLVNQYKSFIDLWS